MDTTPPKRRAPCFSCRRPRGAAAGRFHIVYIFTGNADGNLEVAGSPLVVHHAARFTALRRAAAPNACGQFGCGSVFRLKRDAGGTWTEKTLYNFTGGGDGGVPIWIAGVDSGGAVYVSTSMGNGAISKIGRPPAGHGPWTATVISRFADGGRLFQPTNLILMPDGTLYGISRSTTHGGQRRVPAIATPARRLEMAAPHHRQCERARIRTHLAGARRLAAR